MKIILHLLLSCVLFASNSIVAQTTNIASDTSATFSNPLPVQLGDPYILHTGNMYYMYGTGGADKGFAAYSSTDLVHWKSEGQVYFYNNKNGWSDTAAKWGGAYWAPEVYEVKGKFYLFYSAQWKQNPANEEENFRIGAAVADTPAGPFVDLTNKPVFDPGYPTIDADVFFDDNGKAYLYYSRVAYKHPVESEVADWARKKGWYKEIEESWVYGVELKPDFSGVTGEPVLMLRPPVSRKDKQSDWESRSVTAHEVNRRWTEGSVTFKKDDIYYIMYSANYFGGQYYAVGYATSSSPLGPFKKASDNPVLQKNTGNGGIVSGTGHNSIVYSPDGKEMFCVYHARTTKTGDERVVFIDRMTVKNGKIIVHGPTTTPQLLPSGAKSTTPDSLPANAILLADPAMFHYGNTYYLYGTGGKGNKEGGFFVYTSTDMHNWQGPSGATNGYALQKGEAYGTKGFWAPQVLHYKDSFYMAYAANEQIAIAKSSSPAGPFAQHKMDSLSSDTKQIDPYIFIDEDGKKYLYFVKLTNGNRLFVAELKDDLSDIKPETVKECFGATQPWENTANASWPVTEGPAVLKHKGMYYLVYSANDFRNIDYAVGYATSASPTGPWKKYESNPVLSRHTIGFNGSGHGDFVTDAAGAMWYVFHTHYSNSQVSPRATAIVQSRFVEVKGKEDKLVMDGVPFFPVLADSAVK